MFHECFCLDAFLECYQIFYLLYSCSLYFDVLDLISDEKVKLKADWSAPNKGFCSRLGIHTKNLFSMEILCWSLTKKYLFFKPAKLYNVFSFGLVERIPSCGCCDSSYQLHLIWIISIYYPKQGYGLKIVRSFFVFFLFTILLTNLRPPFICLTCLKENLIH